MSCRTSRPTSSSTGADTCATRTASLLRREQSVVAVVLYAYLADPRGAVEVGHRCEGDVVLNALHHEVLL